MPTYFIHITGQVQGIGFRPYVFSLATQFGLRGWVSNQPDGVHIKVHGDEQKVRHFLKDLPAQAPPLARIQSIHSEEIKDEAFKKFRIRKTSSATRARLMLTPDLAMCAVCRAESRDSKNRRYRYAFTTCTSCGPRYSITSKLPFDREHTSMAAFTMCRACESEYHDPGNRRYYSQTNSCPACPVLLTLYDAQRQVITSDQQEAIASAAAFLKQGKIVAVKGTGGYLLMADATNTATINLLRKRKNRPTKPFALMYPSLEAAKADVLLSEDEQALLQAPEAPIVLARKRAQTASGIQARLVAPGLHRLGLMLPYTPLFDLILASFQGPVIATSGNSRGGHIAFRDDEVFAQLEDIADFVLVHNREILIPQDDSVILYSPKHRQRVILRRARGFAPSYPGEAVEDSDSLPMLALGADLKGTFACTGHGYTFVSQYLGDLSSYDNQHNLKHSLYHLCNLLQVRPSLVLTDRHPEYASVQLAKKLAQQLSVPCVQVQHHEAHFAAVLAENNLLDTKEQVLGVIWDGTGLGNDKVIRGGEFLVFRDKRIAPLAQIAPYPHLLGDKMPAEPRIAALALCTGLEGAERILKPYFTDTEWKLYQSILQSEKYKLQTTSMGRIFDAVAALLGLCTRTSYEGEAAGLLEAVATQAADVFALPGYTCEHIDGTNVQIRSILQQVIWDVQQGISRELIAASFHGSLVNIVRSVAAHQGLTSIAFSGGVFQNSLLLDLLLDKLSPDYSLYFHRQLSPNDECVSFGQLTWMVIKNKQDGPHERQHTVKDHTVSSQLTS